MKVKSYEEMNKEVNDIWSIKDPTARKEALVNKAIRSARTINQGFKRTRISTIMILLINTLIRI